MLRKILMAKLVILAMAAAVFTAILIGMRSKSPCVLRAVRHMNRRCFNPIQMKSAGTPGAYASIVRHTGRTTGATYHTPIDAVPTDDGFVVALPYGMQSDWLQNVLAAGSATIVHEGQSYTVDHPEVVPMTDARAQFPADQQRALRMFKVELCLQLRNAATARVPERAGSA